MLALRQVKLRILRDFRSLLYRSCTRYSKTGTCHVHHVGNKVNLCRFTELDYNCDEHLRDAALRAVTPWATACLANDLTHAAKLNLRKVYEVAWKKCVKAIALKHHSQKNWLAVNNLNLWVHYN